MLPINFRYFSAISDKTCELWICGFANASNPELSNVVGIHSDRVILWAFGFGTALVGGALLLATTQHLAAYYVGSQWMDAVAYVILILFLIAKPLGFSGNRLNKIEI